MLKGFRDKLVSGYRLSTKQERINEFKGILLFSYDIVLSTDILGKFEDRDKEWVRMPIEIERKCSHCGKVWYVAIVSNIMRKVIAYGNIGMVSSLDDILDESRVYCGECESKQYEERIITKLCYRVKVNALMDRILDYTRYIKKDFKDILDDIIGK